MAFHSSTVTWTCRREEWSTIRAWFPRSWLYYWSEKGDLLSVQLLLLQMDKTCFQSDCSIAGLKEMKFAFEKMFSRSVDLLRLVGHLAGGCVDAGWCRKIRRWIRCLHSEPIQTLAGRDVVTITEANINGPYARNKSSVAGNRWFNKGTTID